MKLAGWMVTCVLVAALPGLALGGNVSSHAAITILTDNDFANCNCVTGGTGTTANPYVIGPWSINNVNGDAVFIDGSNLTKSFVLLNLTIAGNATATDRGIVLSRINPAGSPVISAGVYGAQTSIQTNRVGILVQFSSYVTLDGGGANPNGAGIGNKAGTINKNLDGGIDLENSSHVVVRGWQLSASGADHQPDYVTFDPGLAFWGVGGVRLFGVTNSTVDHNAANNCTSLSFGLFHSSNNTVSNNTADYPYVTNFLVTDGSSWNTLSGNVAGTGDFFGFIVADPLPGAWTLAAYGPSHDNVLTGNTSHSNGPTGNELQATIVPAFLGGIAVLNGTYNNQIVNNQLWSDTGGDLVWAQVVPASTPINVVTYPPALHCNVTVSEGGGGVSNRNGNTWTGNVARLIDSCLPPQ